MGITWSFWVVDMESKGRDHNGGLITAMVDENLIQFHKYVVIFMNFHFFFKWTMVATPLYFHQFFVVSSRFELWWMATPLGTTRESNLFNCVCKVDVSFFYLYILVSFDVWNNCIAGYWILRYTSLLYMSGTFLAIL